jgi:hypothetical protein
LYTVCGATASLWSFQPTALDALASRPEDQFNCALLDLNSHCALPESFEGYRVALAGQHHRLAAAECNPRNPCRMAIVPGLGMIDAVTARTLTAFLRAGTKVLLESGAAFLRPGEFSNHQEMLHRHFDIAIDSPVNLWPSKPADEALLSNHRGRHRRRKPSNSKSVPYLDYLWPRETKVRDFSQVIPVAAHGGDVIGRVGALPVALKRRVGKGRLIFLGSPMGPALGAGDLEAHQWLRSVIAL